MVALALLHSNVPGRESSISLGEKARTEILSHLEGAFNQASTAHQAELKGRTQSTVGAERAPTPQQIAEREMSNLRAIWASSIVRSPQYERNNLFNNTFDGAPLAPKDAGTLKSELKLNAVDIGYGSEWLAGFKKARAEFLAGGEPPSKFLREWFAKKENGISAERQAQIIQQGAGSPKEKAFLEAYRSEVQIRPILLKVSKGAALNESERGLLKEFHSAFNSYSERVAIREADQAKIVAEMFERAIDQKVGQTTIGDRGNPERIQDRHGLWTEVLRDVREGTRTSPLWSSKWDGRSTVVETLEKAGQTDVIERIRTALLTKSHTPHEITAEDRIVRGFEGPALEAKAGVKALEVAQLEADAQARVSGVHQEGPGANTSLLPSERPTQSKASLLKGLLKSGSGGSGGAMPPGRPKSGTQQPTGDFGRRESF